MCTFDLVQSLVEPQQVDVVLESTVGNCLREVAAKHGEKPALVEVDNAGQTARRWNYAELLADSEKLGKTLTTRFESGERVCVYSPNSPQWLIMEYACAFAGLVLVTANPAYQPKELRYVLEQSGAVALFLVESYRGNPMAAIGAEASDGLTAIREIVDMNDASAMRSTGKRSAGFPDVTPDDAAQIQYTSGTTGFPKGAVLNHRGLTNNARYYGKRLGAHSDSV